MAPVAAEHFVVGDFFVSQPSATCRFDEELTLKEDYDFTCQHIHLYGSVARCNRLTLLAEHYVNEGGAVSIRNATEEKKNIKRLQIEVARGVSWFTSRRLGSSINLGQARRRAGREPRLRDV